MDLLLVGVSALSVVSWFTAIIAYNGDGERDERPDLLHGFFEAFEDLTSPLTELMESITSVFFGPLERSGSFGWAPDDALDDLHWCEFCGHIAARRYFEWNDDVGIFACRGCLSGGEVAYPVWSPKAVPSTVRDTVLPREPKSSPPPSPWTEPSTPALELEGIYRDFEEYFAEEELS